MSLENIINNEGWTIIDNKSKKRRITNFKPPKYINKWFAEITKADTTLTPKEEEIIANTKLNVTCHCCYALLISDVLCRTFFSCNRCHCCVGDNPLFDDDEWFENCVHREGIFYRYHKDYHYTKDDDFYQNN